MFDRGCTICGWQVEDVLEPVAAPIIACPVCDASTERLWFSKASNVIGDECQFTQTNGLRHPREFRSKQEHRRWLKENGFLVKDSHATMDGTDKAEHTTAWTAGGAAWLKAAEELARRNHNGQFVGNDPALPDVQFPVRWVDENSGL